jgi:hypothetical protein
MAMPPLSSRRRMSDEGAELAAAAARALMT